MYEHYPPACLTNHSFGHNPTYSRTTASTKEDFILEYVDLEDSSRVNDGVGTRFRLRHLDVGTECERDVECDGTAAAYQRLPNVDGPSGKECPQPPNDASASLLPV